MFKNFDGKKFLDGVEGILDLVGERMPDLAAKLGRVVVYSFDIAAGGLFMSWVVSQLAPPEFQTTGKIFSWLLSAATFFIVYKLFERGDGEFGAKQLFGWVINILDALVMDGGGVFVLFGATDILNGGFSGFASALHQMPFIGWIVYIIAVCLSLFAEWYRRKTGDVRSPRQAFSTDPSPQPVSLRAQFPNAK